MRQRRSVRFRCACRRSGCRKCHRYPETPGRRMSRVGRDVLGVVALGALSLLGGEGLAHASSPHSHWIGTWEMSPAGLPTISKIGADSLPPIITVKGTIRYRIRISLGGSQVRLRFSNEYGKSALTVAAVSVA